MLSEATQEMIEAIYPLSPVQQGMLFYSVAAPGTDVYLVQWSCTLPETLQVPCFERAWQRVVERHAVLRTAFLWQDLDEPLQVVGRQVKLQVQCLDWHELASQDVQARLDEWLQADQSQGITLSAAPLMRLTLIWLPDRSYRFVWSYHHLLLDGWSWPLVLQEVFALYEAFVQGEENVLLPDVRPYKDYIMWLQEQDLEEAEVFWRRTLQGFTTATSLGAGQVYRSKKEASSVDGLWQAGFSAAESQTIYTFARQQKITLNTLVQGTWALLLHQYSNSDDIVFGSVVSGRPFELDGVDTMVGVFINTLPVRVRISAHQSCLEWLQELQWQQLDARQYEYSPLAQVQKWSDVPPGQPLFDSLLVFENYPIDTLLRERGRTMAVSNVSYSGRTNYPLTIGVETGHEMVWRIVYDEQRFDAVTIQRMSAHFQHLLWEIVTAAEKRVADISAVGPQEQAFLLTTLNETQFSYSHKAMHEFFEEQVERDPDAVAAVFMDEHVTYRALNRRANWFARHLQELGVAPEALVGLYVERSIDMLVGVLSILKAGGAYVPLDPTYPQERIAYILEDTATSVLLTQQALVGGLPEHNARIVYLDGNRGEITEPDNLELPITADHLAYIIYTSGSTGKPKGVMVPHGGVANIVHTQRQRIAGLSAESRVLQFASLCFDASVWEMVMALATGGALFLGPRETMQGPELVQFLQQHGITHATLPPAVLAALSAEHSLPALQTIVTGGEACPLDVVRRWGSEKALYDFYGPSEVTIASTGTLCRADFEQAPPIGRPILNTQVYLLDEQLRPVPFGCIGEIYLGGVGVTRGYLNRPDLTAERFIPNPFVGTRFTASAGDVSPTLASAQPGERIYRTGDLGRYLPDNQIEYLGRNDHQVKIRGYRIELGEIETALMQHPDVGDAVVLVREEEGVKRLVAYLITQQTELPALELRQFLAARLPAYMVPAAFVPLDSFPLTTNGKVDREALPAPDWDEHARAATVYLAPRTSNEELLVGVWSTVLGRGQIGVHDNFFELGGDSIISLQIVAEAAQVGLQLTPRLIFQYPTISDLAAAVERISEEQERQPEVEVKGEVPLTPIQRWFFEQRWENPHYFNQAQLWSVPADLHVAYLKEALQHLLSHHDALRMRFTAESLSSAPTLVEWHQENMGLHERLFTLERHDLSELSPEERAKTLQREIANAHASLHLSEGPLLRAVLFHYGDHQPGRLLVVIHHLVVDMVSWRILLEDLEIAYAQLLRGEPVCLPAKTSSFKQWSEQLSRYAQLPAVRAELAYWRAIGEEEEGQLPADHPEGRNTVADTGTVEVALEADETQLLLQQVPAIYHTQINDALLLALAQAMARWTNQRTVLVDLEGHGREDIGARLDVSRTVGWFTTIFPVRLTLPATGSIGVVLKQIKEQLRTIPSRGIGYGVLRYLDQEGRRGLQSVPQAQISFNYLGQFDAKTNMHRGHFLAAPEFSGMPHSPLAPRPHLLDLAGYVKDGRLWLTWEYSQQIHERTTIERLAQSYLEALRALIAHCQRATESSYTPSDFPLAQLEQAQLDRIVSGKNIENIYALSPLQQGLLFHALYSPRAGMYIVQRALKFSGQFEVASFMQAWQDLIARHAILRTAFVWEGVSEPVQLVYRTGRFPFHQLDWRGLPEQEQRERLEQLMLSERKHDFDLTQPSLLRLFLIQLQENSYYFVENFHHLLLDGWSSAQLQQELFSTYIAYSQEDTLSLEPVRPYRDYIAWLKQQDSGKAERFWRQKLQGITSPTALPFEREGQVGATPPTMNRGATAQGATGCPEQENVYQRRQMELSPELTSQLQTLARQWQITLNTLLQGAWAFLLSRYSRECDVVYGITVAGRPTDLPGSDRMVGLFINTLPMRVHVPEHASFADWLKQLQEEQAEVQQYEYCPLVQIQGWSDVPRNLPLFNSLFVFENYRTGAMGLGSQPERRLAVDQLYSIEQTNYPLTIVVEPGAMLSLQVMYEASRFSAKAAERILGHLRTILEGLVDQPQKRLIDTSYLTTAERHLLINQPNETATAYPRTQTIHRLFTQQVLRHSGAVAVEYGEEKLTYGELNARANRLAHYLQSLGVQAGDLVALYMERSIDLIVALLGILKAGGAYVPLDLSYPAERLAFMLADTAAPVLITHSTLSESLPPYQGELIRLDSDWPTIARYPALEPEEQITAEYPAYVIYTSGSTGVPKGVWVPHKGVVRLVCETNYMDYNARERIAQMSNVSFDAATFEIWGALLHGACLIGISRDISLSLQDLARYIEQRQVSTLFVTTALFNQIARTVPTLFRTVGTVMFGGEAVDPQWVRTILQQGAPQRLLHVYGPTESTTYATWHKVVEVSEQATTIPIGQPLSNTTCYVLDENLRPVAPGTPGELYIGGDGLALGYLKRPEITAERFVPHPFVGASHDEAGSYGASVQPGARLYRTGDLVCRQEDGAILFLGRIDSQVKLRGFRIELGEIEAVLTQHEQISDAIVLLREDEAGEKRLVAYFLAEDARQAPLDYEQLHLLLQEKLPSYMIPSALVQLEAWPLTPNGKVDRRRLPAPSREHLESRDSYVAPRDETERQLVAIWEQLLQVSPIGVNDNFFVLGGHSLLAIRLMSQVQQKFGKQLALPVLFQCGTIESLAAILRQQEEPETLSPLVAIQPRGARLPLFCVHPGSGNVFQYQELARCLGEDQPVYAFQDTSIYATNAGVVEDSIERMAERYLKELLVVQPSGPYNLCGYSFGGVVAFEMAHRLKQMGHEVALLTIFDGGTPKAIRYAMKDGSDEVSLLTTVSLELLRSLNSWTFQSLYDTLKPLEEQERYAFVLDVLQQAGFTLPDAGAFWLQRQVQVFRSRIKAMHAYQPAIYTGKITLFRVSETDTEITDASLAHDLGWGELSAMPIEFYQIPGHHDTMFIEPHIQRVVQYLQQCLDAARDVDRIPTHKLV